MRAKTCKKEVDELYTTNENRTCCKEWNIQLTEAKLKIPRLSKKKRIPKEITSKTKIGNTKQALSLNQIKAKLKETS